MDHSLRFQEDDNQSYELRSNNISLDESCSSNLYEQSCEDSTLMAQDSTASFSAIKNNDTDIFECSTDSADSLDISDEFTQASCASFAARSMFNWTKNSSNNSNSTVLNSNSSSGSKDSGRVPRVVKRRITQRKITDTFKEEESSKIEPESSEKEVKDIPQVELEYSLIIAGVTVKLPVKPYPSQIAVMNMVISGCSKEQNCLLESPTGSGKTLALLCSVLAWQDSYIEKLKSQRRELYEDDDSHRYPFCYEGDVNMDKGETETCCSAVNKERGAAVSSSCTETIESGEIIKQKEMEPGLNLAVPQIYYCTRTHKQIEQVIKEFKRTKYKYKTMSILSSRNYTCIQDSTKNKTELCQELLDPEKHLGCPYFNHVNKSLPKFRALSSPWDIEDLVKLGKEERSCPYFSARELADKADIIFCPYNYIIDPGIRESMQLNLRGSIIIVDEAHNIEDVCRKVGSVTFREDDLLNVVMECRKLAALRTNNCDMYECIVKYFDKLIQIIDKAPLGLSGPNDNLSSPHWTGSELLEVFKINNIDVAQCKAIVSAAKEAVNLFKSFEMKRDYSEESEDQSNRAEQHSVKDVISLPTKIILEHISFAMDMITSEQHADDYRACVVENEVMDISNVEVSTDTWIPSQKKKLTRLRSLKLICMNPAVIFAPLAKLVRSISLASGTLSPTRSFQSELGVKFSYMLNGNHVIEKDQVYVRCIAKGPTNVTLKANYQCVNNWNFQDELGRVLLSVCRNVPHGVLCFFSSYKTMNNLIKRWRSNKSWDEILRYKYIFIEPRFNHDLAIVMQEYRDVIRRTANSTNDVNGALFLAVFRGKIAEGIDFSDNEARCVLAVGIPYAVKTDPEIEMKFSFNNKNQKKGFLSGSDWYTIQAFRALNQALGRCIRHKHDWGAVLLVDERFLNNSNIQNLPKWIKNMMRTNPNFDFEKDLQEFVATRIEKDKEHVSHLC